MTIKAIVMTIKTIVKTIKTIVRTIKTIVMTIKTIVVIPFGSSSFLNFHMSIQVILEII